MTGKLRKEIRRLTMLPEAECMPALLELLKLSPQERLEISADAAALVSDIRAAGNSGLIEKFLAEYGLNTDEGVALMCLAEAYLRTPDAETLDALISDKIGEGDWARHLGRAESSLVNASTWALMLTGKVFRTIPARADDLASVMRSTVRKLGEPVARTAVGEAMRLMGRQFVLGRSISEALENSADDRKEGYLHSFDMLGEAARTARDAARYFASYANAITAIGDQAKSQRVHENPGISVKLSALHPRYETVNRERVMNELVPRIAELARMAKPLNIPLAIDAEEADRLDLSLDIIEALMTDETLSGWDGLGIVIQAYSRRASTVLDWLYSVAKQNQRKISVRLVKGAYWDSEIKNAQLLGLEGYPVFTRKDSTDVSYLACARKLLALNDLIYPQFATHNAHSVAAINHMASENHEFEFQRLHGMGEALHEIARQKDGRSRRIYAPVGIHKDLLAYLVRRLLENGANSSFVHQILDKAIPAEKIAEDPVAAVLAADSLPHPAIALPKDMFGNKRKNSMGWNLNDPAQLAALEAEMVQFSDTQWGDAGGREIRNPAIPSDLVGWVHEANEDEARNAVSKCVKAAPAWSAKPVANRAAILEKTADLYETNAAELMAIIVREAGKTRLDAIAEIREAVDFLRYYAAEGRDRLKDASGLGAVLCISPWNFPLAIFTGQISGALIAGNSVIAKPAEQTPLISKRAVSLFHEAGLPDGVLELVQGDGAVIGPVLTGDPRIRGAAFTGSTETARLIEISMANEGNPDAPLIAETGGLNAMIVDSTALAEQAVRDIVASAFQSAGQRCSALRILFVQKDIAPHLLEMLDGASHELNIGDPWHPATDVGPVIDEDARRAILDHCTKLEAEGRLLFRLEVPESVSAGNFVPPAALQLESMSQLKHEIFGPVLHVVEYEADDLDQVMQSINAAGYGLTLGIHSRIDTRVDSLCAKADIGNIYVNRNQIGAVVGVQPFGGEGLSGTGPKAGGPHYLTRFASWKDRPDLPARLPQTLRGPTGERNSYGLHPRGVIACLGPGAAAQDMQAKLVTEAGNTAFKAVPGNSEFDMALERDGLDAVIIEGELPREWRKLLAEKPGRRIPLIHVASDLSMLFAERSISEDTTASGGNATLLSSVS
ncbi:MAG: bifunctional proline dehydrogenase/L-glutamate gamma-semialdehyde dehydrogenase PutA [Rhizobiaceae bacterium]